ncbi:MAG: 50S ribosomal protein L16 [Candidatus Nezhaarchaeota archaeon]|nr:50S ribosomal protein L16 [Candidatus Nezhaarchaeota archaeon]MCX8141866.1 50S ribosomal protein L16 [Candidatus Nezhaarchaeota archaeon]MDW8050353.1 50S ribosomal protein L16 [Nitrososphaerota archaeon]
MPLRPAHCYREVRGPAYARKEYIHGIPQPKITKFTMGNSKAAFPLTIQLIAKEPAQIRHNALEAMRVICSKYLASNLGESNYFLKIHPYPHHVLRENKMMAFAGADRLQDGMRLAFGDPVGTAARVKVGDVIMTIKVPADKLDVAKEAAKRAASKLPVPCEIKVLSSNGSSLSA